MKKHLHHLLVLMQLVSPLAIGDDAVCTGDFPNLITDVCWDCMFPVSFAGGILNFGIAGDDYDTGVGRTPVCICASGLAIGTPMGFWEPRWMVDVTNSPGCMPLMGGLQIDPPFNETEFGATMITNANLNGRSKAAFMHANEYLNPFLSAAGVIESSPCLDNRSFDIPYLSWADPTWGDDTLSLMLTPYAYAFSGVASIAAEAPDAIQATIGFPNQYLFWVAGSWGPIFPLTGNVSNAGTNEQVSHLLLTRVLAKLHAAGTQQTTAGKTALEACNAFGMPEIIMDKRQYKTNRTFPFPDNMCTPIGRPLLLQESGASRPQDKDYGYFVWQRKDCCLPLN